MTPNNLDKLTEAIPYQWRVQTMKYGTAVCVAYIDSRDVQNKLDSVVGPANWQCDYKEVKGNVYCGVAILVDGQWVWKWDCGTESNQDKEKGEASDSFKRAAVKWGIGRFLYDLPIQRLKIVKVKDKDYPADDKGNAIYDGETLTAFITKRIKQAPGANANNHKSNIQDDKPLITNIQFKKLMERMDKGDKDAGKKALETFSFESTQLNMVNQKLSA